MNVMESYCTVRNSGCDEDREAKNSELMQNEVSRAKKTIYTLSTTMEMERMTP